MRFVVLPRPAFAVANSPALGYGVGWVRVSQVRHNDEGMGMDGVGMTNLLLGGLKK